MHVNAKQMAYLGVLLAVCQVLLVMGSVAEISSASLIVVAAATIAVAFFMGGRTLVLVYYTAALILGFLLVPDKFHVISFAVLGLYLLFICILEPILIQRGVRTAWIWGLKLGLFNLFLIPALIFLPHLIFAEEVPGWLIVSYGLLANVVIVLCDFLYRGFELRFRKKIEFYFKRR